MSCAPLATVTALSPLSAWPPRAISVPALTFVAPLAVLVPGDDQRSGAGLGEIAETRDGAGQVKVCASSTLNVPPPVPDTG